VVQEAWILTCFLSLPFVSYLTIPSILAKRV
jgi:hypothetical protein